MPPKGTTLTTDVTFIVCHMECFRYCVLCVGLTGRAGFIEHFHAFQTNRSSKNLDKAQHSKQLIDFHKKSVNL